MKLLRVSFCSTILLTALLLARPARAVYPASDCEEFGGTGSMGGWTFMDVLAVHQKLVSGVWQDADQATTSVFLPFGGGFKITGLWPNAGTFLGTYRTKLTITAYVNGSGTTPPTESELESWPPQYKFPSTEQNQQYNCGPNGPVITSSPPTTADVARASRSLGPCAASAGASGPPTHGLRCPVSGVRPEFGCVRISNEQAP